MTDEERDGILFEIRDLLKGRSVLERAGALLSQPDWCRVSMDCAASAVGYMASARPRENVTRWLRSHDVILLDDVGHGWTCTVGDLRRALLDSEAEQKRLDHTRKHLTGRVA